ncbi:Bestrophin, RFP-TM, chloride channel-domain-containing protein [Suillus ampliporus]|nr:Bestrophin, RFP-TM, chloride channel-domain-containing protein [Suillus ampliporus]
MLSTTALSRCWPVLIVTGVWSSAICVLNYHTHGKLSIQPTLITVFGTVLGFVLSFRTSSSFDRYNEGRKYWAQIVLNCRIFARTVWFHVPDNAISVPKQDRPISDEQTAQEEARTLIEKKTVVNLLEAYAVAVKHYLRGEEGIHYEDLYPLVPFLSSSNYSFPAIIPSANDTKLRRRLNIEDRSHNASASSGQITQAPASPDDPAAARLRLSSQKTRFGSESTTKTMAQHYDEESLRPAESPPGSCWRTAYPFPFFFWVWRIIKQHFCKVGADDTGRDFRPSKNNVPLEISLYLTSYVSALQFRKTVDHVTLGFLCGTLNQLVDALTGLERILTTPIPVSYATHLRMVTVVYCGTLPFQLWSTLKWLTIPASVIASFIFFGFVVAGEEIESYDKNDLDMCHFVQNIIRKELHAITATPAPDPAIWAFSPQNDFLGTHSKGSPMEIPSVWLEKGKTEICSALYG